MDELKQCPICGEKKLFIAVHDDEGNYKGRLGCGYESDPWSGLSYAIHHEGWGECPLCTDGANEVMGGMLFDTAEEAVKALEPERPKGRWKYYHKRNITVCTNCSFERKLDADFGKAITCPNCGADMRGDSDV